MNKKKKIILCMLFILGTILIICTIILNNYNTVKNDKYETEIVDGLYTQKDLDVVEDSVASYVSDKVVPTGISKLYGQYRGKNELSDLYRGIKKVSDYIPVLLQDLNGKTDEEIKKYYKNNNKEVLQNTGIIKETDFIQFAKYILQFNSLEILNSSSIITDTISSDTEFLTFNLKLVYENEQEIYLKTYFKKQKDEINPLFKFLITEDF